METIFWSLVAGLGLYEVAALVTRREGDTVSEIVWRLSRRPLVPFALGFLMGHLFW